MTLFEIIGWVALSAGIWTGLVAGILKKSRNLPITFLQAFCGILFVFSGWVKVIDPLGTAYKMEQYFAEFKVTFAQASMDSVASFFPILASYALVFAMVMIVMEIVLGIMLLFGLFPKFTSWAFFLLILFFTLLTGFTYLTGYVPEGVNFFSFSRWGGYVETNMKVTDCGCFGDFIKLKPKVSFLKDVFLLIPSLTFLFFRRHMFELTSDVTRNSLLVLSVVGFTFYGFSNFLWDLPHTDFRPFKVGNNIREMRKREKEAAAAVRIVAYRMTNIKSGEVVELPFEAYLADYAKYPTSDWKLEQVKSEPSVEKTKVSDFEVADLEGQDMTESILDYPGFSFMIVAYNLQETVIEGTIIQKDSLFRADTLGTGKTMIVTQVFERMKETKVPVRNYSWKENYLQDWSSRLLPVMLPLVQEKIKVFAVTRYTDKQMIGDFKNKTGANFPIYLADDILLKTIIRSNPGVVLLKDGEVVANWHIRQLPSASDLMETFGLGK